MITHHHITRVSYLVMVAFVLTAGLVLAIYSSVEPAQATPGMIPFGGFIVTNVPLPVGFPAPICPPHILITDYTGGVPKPIGLTFGSLSDAPTFEFYNLFTPGIATVGEYEPFPLPDCITAGVPYPVFEVFYNVPYGLFQMGTGDVPGI